MFYSYTKPEKSTRMTLFDIRDLVRFGGMRNVDEVHGVQG